MANNYPIILYKFYVSTHKGIIELQSGNFNISNFLIQIDCKSVIKEKPSSTDTNLIISW